MLDSEATACTNGEGCEMKAGAEKKPMAYKGSIQCRTSKLNQFVST